jgi:hypothetical protein
MHNSSTRLHPSEEIAPTIAAKIASVNEPLHYTPTSHVQTCSLGQSMAPQWVIYFATSLAIRVSDTDT